MPNYEVQWGSVHQIVNAGNPYQACMIVVQQENLDDPSMVFEVNTLGDNPRKEQIGLDQIFNLLLLAQPEDEGVVQFDTLMEEQTNEPLRTDGIR